MQVAGVRFCSRYDARGCGCLRRRMSCCVGRFFIFICLPLLTLQVSLPPRTQLVVALVCAPPGCTQNKQAQNSQQTLLGQHLPHI